MGEVKVFGSWYSPFVRRVELALKLKGIEYEYIEEDLQNKSALLLKYNPVHKKVPVLLHNGKPIAESSIILEYVDEVWGGAAILPKDPHERAKARFWAKFIDDKCTFTLWKACWSRGEEGEKAKEEATEALKFLENELSGNKFFGGDNIGLVDITADFLACLFPVLQEIVGLQLLTEENFPNLCRWADEYRNNGLVKENMPDKDRLVAKFKPK